MRTAPIFGLIACMLLPGGWADAAVVTVEHTVDYTYNVWNVGAGIWFIPPAEVLDHWPYCRNCDEDWGWPHTVTAWVPASAIGIESATLSIVAWGVDGYESEEDTTGEVDIIYAEGIKLGLLESYLTAPISVPWPPEGQPGAYMYMWSLTTFDLPNEVLDPLWLNGHASIWIDISRWREAGHRVTLKHSTLTIRYLVEGGGEETAAPVYRFWSPLHSRHFYTISETERDHVISTYPLSVWTYEGEDFYAYPGGSQPLGTAPVYRFWSPLHSGHFYTISETEKDHLISTYPPETWTYEGVAFYAYPEGSQPLGTSPVYRFWSPLHSGHFYTINAAEKDHLISTYPPETWTYEGVAWYAYAP